MSELTNHDNHNIIDKEEPKPAVFLNSDNHYIVKGEELKSFYDTMKETVVLVHVTWALGSSDESEEGTCMSEDGSCSPKLEHSFGTGVTYDKQGSIMTCFHIFCPDDCHAKAESRSIEVRYYNMSGFVEASMFLSVADHDFAILKPVVVPDEPIPFATLATSSIIKIGMQALSITCPSSFVFSFGNGHVAHPKRIARDFPFRNPGQMEKNIVDTYDESMRLIQFNGILGSGGSSGGPIFNNSGLIIGLHLFEYANFMFSSHCRDLRRFTKKEQDTDHSEADDSDDANGSDEEEEVDDANGGDEEVDFG